uniref:Response regulator receiver domain-containing protein n=1 Tax=Candidatus Kentrum sp. MB TaxID=2138164 RepID=A0A450X8M7_9GAMM|nr:MAG: Response regulator receiver domain-containing protein [Candidatus Kentron sp. MB]VFK31736.1 MAG: Response regulator receiver domain-containing protein [Candidatus Kentron sp. MB]VFK75635.1 MAG: Response regulator receiver domain-containing protein [Candidatus Kentron sp. MB]
MNSNARILVVDDEEDIVREFKRALKSKGYDVAVAYSGEEAWEKYQQQYFDVVLADWKMGRMNGMDLLEKIDGNAPRSRVIMITAFGDEDSAIEAHHRHAFDYLKKPVDRETLLNAVAKAAALRDPIIEALEEWVEKHPEEADEQTHVDFSNPPQTWSAREMLAEIQGNTERGREEYKNMMKLTFYLMTRGKIDMGVFA